MPAGTNRFTMTSTLPAACRRSSRSLATSGRGSPAAAAAVLVDVDERLMLRVVGEERRPRYPHHAGGPLERIPEHDTQRGTLD